MLSKSDLFLKSLLIALCSSSLHANIIFTKIINYSAESVKINLCLTDCRKSTWTIDPADDAKDGTKLEPIALPVPEALDPFDRIKGNVQEYLQIKTRKGKFLCIHGLFKRDSESTLGVWAEKHPRKMPVLYDSPSLKKRALIRSCEQKPMLPLIFAQSPLNPGIEEDFSSQLRSSLQYYELIIDRNGALVCQPAS